MQFELCLLHFILADNWSYNVGRIIALEWAYVHTIENVIDKRTFLLYNKPIRERMFYMGMYCGVQFIL